MKEFESKLLKSTDFHLFGEELKREKITEIP